MRMKTTSSDYQESSSLPVFPAPVTHFTLHCYRVCVGLGIP